MLASSRDEERALEVLLARFVLIFKFAQRKRKDRKKYLCNTMQSYRKISTREESDILVCLQQLQKTKVCAVIRLCIMSKRYDSCSNTNISSHSDP